MAAKRKRRILIAAVIASVIGILFISGERKETPDYLFRYLVRHPMACNIARYAFFATGRGNEFNKRVSDAVDVEIVSVESLPSLK